MIAGTAFTVCVVGLVAWVLAAYGLFQLVHG